MEQGRAQSYVNSLLEKSDTPLTSQSKKIFTPIKVAMSADINMRY